MAGKVHSKPIDAPEVAVVSAALTACALHMFGVVTLSPVDYGVAVGACMTPVVMFIVRIAMAAAHRVEDAVVAEEEGEES
jgi:hypothetical protein